MARPRLNRNGLWAKIFGKIVGKSQKSKKIAKILGKFSKKSQKNSEKIVETSENFPKPLPPTYKSARNPKSFSSRIAYPLSKP